MATWWYEWWRWLIMDKIWQSSWSWIIGTLLKTLIWSPMTSEMLSWWSFEHYWSSPVPIKASSLLFSVATPSELAMNLDLDLNQNWSKLIKTIILNSPGIEVVLGKLLWETQVIVVRVRAQQLQRQIQSQSNYHGKLDIKSIQRFTNRSCLLTWIKNGQVWESWV